MRLLSLLLVLVLSSCCDHPAPSPVAPTPVKKLTHHDCKLLLDESIDRLHGAASWESAMAHALVADVCFKSLNWSY